MLWKKKNNGISIKINLVAIFIITVFMLINGIYSYLDYKNKELRKKDTDLKNILQRLSENTVNALWNYNETALKEIITLEMESNYIYGIVVQDGDTTIASMIKDKNQDYSIIEIEEKEQVNKFLSANTEQKNIVVTHEDEQLAQITVVLSDHFINKELFFIMLKTIIQSLILAIALFTLLSISINKIVSKPIKTVVKAANDIADGDMTTNELKIKSKDELGILITSFNKMLYSLKNKMAIIEKIAEGSGDFTVEVELASDRDIFGKTIAKMLNSLNDILGQVNSTINKVSSGSNQVSQASEFLSQGAATQASSLEEITSSIVEISNQAKQNADNAEKGNIQMKELVTAMGNINKNADEIKRIVKVIDDIAFQTNLLALNANVEAARAGKYGKGFAVVAEEVRNLASRSAESVQETTTMVEETIKNINSGNNLVEITANQLEEIVTASKEQTLGLNQINTGLSQIDQVTQTNTANAEQSAAAAKELADQAQMLNSVVASFKLIEHKIVNEPNQIEVAKGEMKNINNTNDYINISQII
jgi:methyl-accepting chemotaxis protein